MGIDSGWFYYPTIGRDNIIYGIDSKNIYVTPKVHKWFEESKHKLERSKEMNATEAMQWMVANPETVVLNNYDIRYRFCQGHFEHFDSGSWRTCEPSGDLLGGGLHITYREEPKSFDYEQALNDAGICSNGRKVAREILKRLDALEKK